MTELAYFPGCTLSTKAAGYDRSGRAVMDALGITLRELEDWNCCGATFPLATDNSLALIGPARILTQAETESDEVAALCAICYHVLKRTQVTLDRDPDMLDRINWFTEAEYAGKVRVTHLLEVLRDRVTWDAVRERVARPLTGLKLAPYYGCMLLRPQDEIGLDDSERPRILHDCIGALGAEPVDFAYAVECCGSYLAVKRPDVPDKVGARIAESARRAGADAIITACPLCQFNLDHPQKEDGIPVLYFSQVIAAAFGLPRSEWGLEEGKHYVDPGPLFEREAVQ
jgi:heterodisulfide reductase subunit B